MYQTKFARMGNYHFNCEFSESEINRSSILNLDPTVATV
jgi:hypothetical protein